MLLEALYAWTRAHRADDRSPPLAAHADKWFADAAAWQTHLERLGIAALRVTPVPTHIGVA